MQIQGITNYGGVPKATFVDDDGETIANHEKPFDTAKSVVPTSEEWQHMRDEDAWLGKMRPVVRSTDIGPLLWDKSDDEAKDARRQLEEAISLVEEVKLRVIGQEITTLEVNGKELRKQARAALDMLPGLQDRLANSESILREAGFVINRQRAKLDEVRSQRPHERTYPTEAELMRWVKRVEAAEEKMKQLQADSEESSRAASLLGLKRNNCTYDLREAERGIALNAQRLNQLKRLAGIPISEAKQSSYRGGNEFGLG